MLSPNETAMLSYTIINSHSQVSDPGPNDPLDYISHLRMEVKHKLNYTVQLLN